VVQNGKPPIILQYLCQISQTIPLAVAHFAVNLQ